MIVENKPVSFYKKHFIFIISFLALLAQRFFHFGNVIREPMAWRQYDTEFYAYDFYLNGINLFKPAVSWMGAYKTTVLEFPLISAIISILYSIFSPEVFYGRIVIFLFYTASACYFFILVKHLYYERLAKISVLVYLLLPLSLFYSTALNIDYPVMFFLFSSLYYFIISIDKKNYGYALLAVSLFTIGFLIKAPYMFFIFIPLIWYVIKLKQFRFFLKIVPLLILPLILFYFWQRHTIFVNANSPDWFFIPDYFKFTNMSSWYFGALSDRLVFINWERLMTRFAVSGITYIGFPLFLIGLFTPLGSAQKKTFFYLYFAGCIVYLLIFFMLNVIHDYYQIPFVAASAFFIACGVDYIYKKLINKKTASRIVLGFIMFVLIVNGLWFAERWYYRVDIVRNSTAAYIKENTPADALVIASIDLTDPRDPRILAAAHRYGWAISTSSLHAEIIEKLKENGADYLSVTLNKSQELNQGLSDYLKKYSFKQFLIPGSDWKVLIFSLQEIK